MGWLFGKKPRAEWRDKPQAITSAIPRDDDRAGPVPPPPRTAHAPGVAIYSFEEIPSPRLLRLDTGIGGFFLEGEEGKANGPLLLLSSCSAPSALPRPRPAAAPAPGDVLIWDAAPSRLSPALPHSKKSPGPLPAPSHHIRRDDLAGRGVSGITGLRSRHAADGITVLRLGPPPGARWVFVGLHAIAVFAGKFTLVDGDEPKLVPAGRIALVGDPTATLYVEAGNDSALGVALGGARVVSALG